MQVCLFVLVIGVLMMTITGCATDQASQDPNVTQEQMAEAKCQDIQDAIFWASTILISTNLSEAQLTYWNKYLAGAQQAHGRYCGGGM
ncbi:MAG: hypothetical protein AAGU11_00935 [Syntrophobacteraceae bacterium]